MIRSELTGKYLMKQTKLRKTYNILIRLAIITLTLFYIYDQVVYRKDLDTIIDFLPAVSGSRNFAFLLAIVLILVPLNQWLEIIKWKFLIDKLEKVSYWNATKAVLTGISVSMFMPNRVGDYLGRVFVLKEADRLQAVLATIMGGIAQLITTILFGCSALLIFFPHYYDMSSQLNIWIYLGLILAVMMMLGTIVFAYLNFATFSDIIKRITGRSYARFRKYAIVFSWYSANVLLRVLVLSMMRYMVFSLQFYLLLLAFQVSISYPAAMVLIGLVYLLMTVIPTVALTELGVRGSVSLMIFALYFEPLHRWTHETSLAVVSSTTVLWLLNLAFPALLGIVFVYSLRFFRKINGNGN
jgi:hypothetical protein